MADSKLVLLTPVEGGAKPDQGLPPGRTWPPTIGYPLPGYPDQGLPGGGDAGTPEHPIVIPPGDGKPPELPPAIWPGVPIHPETPDNSLPLPPGMVWPPLPPSVDGKAVVLVWIPTVGYRYVVVDVRNQPKPPMVDKPGASPKK